MHRIAWTIAVVLVAGCDPIPSSGDVLAPVRVAEPSAPQAELPDDSLFFEEVDDADEGEPVELSPERLAAGLGLGSVAVAEEDEEPPPVTPPVAPPPVVAAVAPAAVAPEPWSPATPLDGSWGVRLVSTVLDAHPPRAIIGLPDGSETVVQAGTLLPEAGVVVLAIGRDLVQVAEILPQGDHARVETRTLPALYPSEPRPR